MPSTPAESVPAPEDAPEDPPVGALENPGLASFQSGSGLLSDNTSEAHNPHLVRRYLSFHMPRDSSSWSKWVIDEVRIAKSRHKWIAVPGEDKRNNFGEFEGYALGGAWTDRIRYDPPVDDELFLLHPDAPKNLIFKFRIRLRSRLRTKRKVDVIPGI